jgi:hypothetical protein
LQVQTKKFAVTLALVAMLSFIAWPLWQAIITKEANREMQARVQALAAKDVQLKAALDVAMLDGVLTVPEAEIIIKGGGEEVNAAE